MFFIGNRYLPGEGTEALSIEDDDALGLWVVSSKGEVSRIEMKPSATEKRQRSWSTTLKNTSSDMGWLQGLT